MRRSLPLFLAFLMLACEESLPPRIIPVQGLQITEFSAAQGTDSGGRPIVSFLIVGQNTYHETFFDHVDLTGQIKIWWNREPQMVAHVYLNSANFHRTTDYRGGRLRLDPGETFALTAVWNFFDDEGRDVLNLLDYTGQPVEGGIIRSRPVRLYCKAELILFRQVGLLSTETIHLDVIGWKVVGNEPAD